MEDEIQVGGRHEYWYRTWSNEELLGALPPPPQFDPDLDSLRVSIAKTIGKVTVPREVTYLASGDSAASESRRRAQIKTGEIV